jgi:hypothetical protein
VTDLPVIAFGAGLLAVIFAFGSFLVGGTRRDAALMFGVVFCVVTLPVVAVEAFGLEVCAAFTVGALAVAAYLLRRNTFEILLGGGVAAGLFGGLHAYANRAVLGTVLSIALVAVVVAGLRMYQDSREARLKAEREAVLAANAQAEAEYHAEQERQVSEHKALDARVGEYVKSGLTLDEWNKQRPPG